MGRLRSRILKSGSSAVHVPTSWSYVIVTLGFALVWALFIIFTVTALSCVQAIGITLHKTMDVATIDWFWLGFSALGILTFVNTVRYRTQRQHYTHRVFEALLIFFGLVTLSEWENHVHPGLGDRPVMEFIHDEVVVRLPGFQMDEFVLETAGPSYPVEPVNDVEWGSFPELGPPAPYVNEADFLPAGLTRRAQWCACWNNRDEYTRSEHYDIDEGLYYGFLTLKEAEEQRALLYPLPVEEAWCPAVRDLARQPRN